VLLSTSTSKQSKSTSLFCSNGAIDFNQYHDTSLKLFNNEFGIKFTKMHIERQISDHSTANGPSNTSSAGIKQPKAVKATVLQPSFENCLGLSSISQEA
jgi:hypothetical protein